MPTTRGDEKKDNRGLVHGKSVITADPNDRDEDSEADQRTMSTADISK